MAIHSNILARRIPWTEEPGQLQSMGSHRAGHDIVIKQQYHDTVWITVALFSLRLGSLILPAPFFFFQDCVGYLGSLMFLYKLKKLNFNFVKNAISSLIGIALNL